MPFPMGHDLYAQLSISPRKWEIYSSCVPASVCTTLRDVRKEELDCERRNCVCVCVLKGLQMRSVAARIHLLKCFRNYAHSYLSYYELRPFRGCLEPLK